MPTPEPPQKRRPLSFIVPLAIGAAIAAGITYEAMKPSGQRHPMTPIESGVLYRSGQLEPAELEREIRDRGIKTVVNLGSQENWDEAVCRKLGVKYIDMPVGDVWCICGETPPGHESKSPAYDMTAFWDLLNQPEQQPVLMHCWGGVHRTGVTAAIYRIRYNGWTAEEAIRELDLYGFESFKSKFENIRDYLHQIEDQVARERSAEKSVPHLARPLEIAPSESPF